MTKSWQYQSDVQPVYVPPPPGNDGSGTHHFSVMYQPRLPAPYRQPAYQPIMADMDPAALLLADEAIPGQGPDATGQNHFSVAYQPRLLPPAWACYDPIESPLDPDSFIVGNAQAALPDAMGATRVQGSGFRVQGSGEPLFPLAPIFDLQFAICNLQSRRSAMQPPPTLPPYQQPIVTPLPDAMGGRVQSPKSKVQSQTSETLADVSSAAVPPNAMESPVQSPKSKVQSQRSETIAPQLYADTRLAGWWRELDAPTLLPRRSQSTADGAGLFGVLAPVGFVSAPLALPTRDQAAAPSQGRGEIVTDPGSVVPDGQFAANQPPPVHQNSFRPKPTEDRSAFADVGHEGVGAAMQPLAQPLRHRQPSPIAGETLLYAPLPPAVQLIVGCELYAAAPARPTVPRQQPGAQQSIVAQAVTLGIDAMESPVKSPKSKFQIQPGGWHYTDVGHTGADAAMQPLAAPLAIRPRVPAAGETLVQPVTLAPVEVIVGYDGAPQLPAQAGGAARPLPAQGVIVTEPTPVPASLAQPVMPPRRRSLPAASESHPIFTDVPAAGGPLDSIPLRAFAPSRATIAGNESLVYAPAPAPVEVIVGCDLYAAVPVRPRTPVTQPAAQQPSVAQAVSLDFLNAAIPQILERYIGIRPIEQPAAKIDAPAIPDSLAVPVFTPRRSPTNLVEPPPAPQSFQVLAGLDSMAGGAIAARMRPQAASVLVIDQQNYRVPEVAGFQSAWPAPPRSAPRPVWQPIESISTTVFYGETGNPPAFTGSGQILVTATDLWVFSPTAARVEASQRGNRTA